MSRLVIAVSGINAVDNPGPGVGVARGLKADRALDCEVIGLAYDAMEPGIFLDWLIDGSYLMPYPTVGGEAVIERLLEIQAERGLDVVIPNLDAELPVYIRYAGELEAHGIRVLLPTLTQFRLRSKDHLVAAAPGWGCSAPATAVLNAPGQLDGALAAIGYPAWIKGCLYEAYRCHTAAEAYHHADRLVAEWGWPLLVQEPVQGEHLNLVGLGTGDGGHLGMVALKKLNLTKAGKIWTGVTVLHPGMLAVAERFIAATRWRGPFELECIVGKKPGGDGEAIHVIEINPRFPAWVNGATGVGVNLPARLVRHLLGLPQEPLAGYPAGKLFIRYTDDLIADLSAFQSLVTTGAAS
jgi:carbamoyl-phosphate synthase large subunit